MNTNKHVGGKYESSLMQEVVLNASQNGTFLIRPSNKQPDKPFTLVLYLQGVRNIHIRMAPDGSLALGESQKYKEKVSVQKFISNISTYIPSD